MTRPTDAAFPFQNDPGLTKREYALIHIMPAVIAAYPNEARDILAMRAIQLVDALFWEMA